MQAWTWANDQVVVIDSGRPFEPVAHHDAHVVHAPVFDLRQHREPEFGGSAQVRAKVCMVVAELSHVG
jgi:hypothetical protein